MTNATKSDSSPELLVADAVFEGGGVKGIGLVGALAYCEEKGYSWKSVAGTSAGAITAALVAADYTAAEIKAELDRLMRDPDAEGCVGYERFKDKSLLDRIPGLGPAMSLAFEKGIYEGDFFEAWLRELLEKKSKRTFADLVNEEHADDPKDSPYRYRLRVIASDITRRRMLVLPQGIVDYEGFDGDPDKLEIARAVRMSMSIPFFFEPVEVSCKDAKFRRTEKEQDQEAITGSVLLPPPRSAAASLWMAACSATSRWTCLTLPRPARRAGRRSGSSWWLPMTTGPIESAVRCRCLRHCSQR